jgi:ubiquinone/menaquinone biosynthesis C-methylase UbiE
MSMVRETQPKEDVMHGTTRDYVPAAGHAWALPLYDPLLRLFRIDQRRERLIDGAGLQAKQRVLDVGCGTGSLLIALARRAAVHATGLDPDPAALRIARAKAERAGLAVRLEQSFSDAMPFPEHGFEHVFSSFMFHHLDAGEKRAMLREVLRVLAPGGHFHLMDFRDEPQHKSAIMRALHSLSAHQKLRGQIEGGVERMLAEAGFTQIEVESRPIFWFGAVGIYRARAP